jgi:hypothetical protein
VWKGPGGNTLRVLPFPDGAEQIQCRLRTSRSHPRREHLEHARLLGRLTGLPVNGDFEDGYGDTPEGVTATVEAAVEQATKALVAGDLASATTSTSFERISELLVRGKN